MKTRYILLVSAALASLVSCDKFLDTMPDNRAEINSVAKVKAMLVSGYPDHNYSMVTELISDNMDDNAAVVNNATPGRFYEDTWAWKDVTDTSNDSPENIWGTYWGIIAAANQALEAIDNLGGPDDNPDLAPYYGEAHLVRAYGHFILVNLFCLNYNPATSSSDQGIPYMEMPEQGLNPQYERGNVAEVYEKIERDLEIGLEYVSDVYDVPKYHFNRQAAYAFATRFYLFYEKFDKAIECADECLGSAPESLIRDYVSLQSNYSTIADARLAYNSTDQKANFLMMTGYSNQGLFWGNYSGSNKRFGNTTMIWRTEGPYAPMPWMDATSVMTNSSYVFRPRTYNSSLLHYDLFWRVDYEFEYTDPVAGIGYRHVVWPEFTADQVLLERAEAEILTHDFDAAVADLNLWANNIFTADINITTEMVQDFYANQIEYYNWKNPTPKKHLSPAFSIDEEGSVQESMLQLVLNAKRTETLGFGQRWFDIKRYGIKIYRRAIDASSDPESVSDSLEVNDPRRAIQIPQKARDAGFEPSKR